MQGMGLRELLLQLCRVEQKLCLSDADRLMLSPHLDRSNLTRCTVEYFARARLQNRAARPF